MKFFVCRHVSIIYDDSEIVSVCPYPDKRNNSSFVNISPTVVIDTSMERSSRALHHGPPPPQKKKAYLSVSAVMFCKQCLAYAVHSDRCYP